MTHDEAEWAPMSVDVAFTDHQRPDGLVQRELTLDRDGRPVTGVLWLPARPLDGVGYRRAPPPYRMKSTAGFI